MRIVFAWHAAVEPEYRKLFKEFAGMGHSVTVISPEAWREGGRDQHAYTVEADGYRLLGLPVAYKNKPKRFFYTDAVALALTIRMSRPDVVHVFEEPYSAAAFQLVILTRLFGRKAKIVMESFENINAEERSLPARFERYTLKRCDALIAVPGEGAEVWRAKGCGKPIKQVPVGVDENFFKKTEGTIPGLEFLDERDKVRIAYVGRLTDEKGIGMLMEAFAVLTKAGEPCELALVGGGEAGKYKARCKELGIGDSVTFIAAVESAALPLIYSKVDILVLPSLTTPQWKEQFGRVLIEAMACGVTVVGSSSGEIPNVIGDAGVIFKEGDANGLAAALRKLVNDKPLRDSYAAAGRKRVLEKFTWRRVANELVKVYEEVLNR
ncbi:MAG: glycosyltransferase [Deltaproteobacteria bacterium]|nr:glycosyltransferase [Deltaproteobacteria bacterium]